jgi:uncharacterized protein YjbJ (UPF0337 family)
MKNLPWLLAALGLGIVAYVIGKTPGPQYATGSDTLEDAARGTSQWGSKARVRGAGGKFVGKVKESFGRATGNPDLADEGVTDQITGSLKNAAGQVAEAAGQTIHELNR